MTLIAVFKKAKKKKKKKKKREGIINSVCPKLI